MKSENKIESFFHSIFTHHREISPIRRIEDIVAKMKPSEKVFFYIVCLVSAVSGLLLLVQVHNSFLVEVPSFGGKFTEGVVGSPRFLNPILALSDTDKDLSSLVYSGLLKSDGSGNFVPDLAESYTISETAFEYDFVIRN